MSHSITLAPHCNSHQFVLEGLHVFSQRRGVTLLMVPTKLKNTRLCHTLHRRGFCSSYTNDNTHEVSGAGSHEGSEENEENKKGGILTSNETLKKLRRYGLSGILSYGLLNTAYYLATFLVVWFYIAPAPAKMGYLAAVERFLKVMAMVWAGSQVTKLIRAGGALALAPFVDRGLSWFTAKFKFQSQDKAFMAIVGCCFGLAIIVFLVITLLWA
ncbi:PREDICTED: uncharacterized protein LOC109329769 isoform X1 [Lupinus angustifolius]|uniref:uncharacterized protein LOC109329769 isoform X1 n=1 Tax=Lupinus angustifolius TaxID=3871 RepID=UPI00092EEADD|nr:PREDICTED: uncharacterized protein LOC109329769 isoform X1 [Lupinus angustifolius]